MRYKNTFYCILVIVVLCFNIQLVKSQEITTDWICNMSGPLTESSGLTVIIGKWIPHNDSNGEASLYEIDTLLGVFSREVEIANAFNQDWEEYRRF